MTDDDYRVWHPWTRMGEFARERPRLPVIVRASGSTLHAVDGRQYLDACAGMWNVNLGHGRADVVEAIAGALRELTFLPNIGLPSPPASRLAAALLRLAPEHVSRVMFHSTGTAAVESAVLLCRQFFRMTGQPRRTGVIALERGYHGCSLLGSALSGYPEDARWLGPLPAGVRHVPAPDGEAAARASAAALRRLLDAEGETIAALVFEPIMALAGVIVPPAWWVEEVLALCRARGVKVIADEVVTGVGRSGAWLACPDPRVDVFVLGKGLSGGYVPLAATLIGEALFEPFSRADGVEFKSGSTMDGCPAACAAGLAVLAAIEAEGLVERAARVGDGLRARLSQGLAGVESVAAIRGRGLMIGVSLRGFDGAMLNALMHRFAEAGVLMHPAYGAELAIMPPLTITEAEAERLADACVAVLRAARGSDATASRGPAAVSRR